MLLALLQRLGQMVFVMFGISMLVFLIFFATPGADPAARIAGRNATPEVLEAVRKSFGFDQPFYVQYLTMMKKIFITGDLTSFVNRGWKVVPAVMDTVPVTLSLVMGAAVLWVVFSLIIGIVAAATRGSWIDKTLSLIAFVWLSIPEILSGLLLLMLAARTGWFPVGGTVSIDHDQDTGVLLVNYSDGTTASTLFTVDTMADASTRSSWRHCARASMCTASIRWDAQPDRHRKCTKSHGKKMCGRWLATSITTSPGCCIWLN